MVEVIRSLNPARKFSLISALLILLCLFVAGAVWLLTPSYSVLFNGLDSATASQAISQLEEKQIPFKVLEANSGNVISVPEEQVEQLKVTMTADLGLPDVKGLELFDNADYSMTDFSQDVTYKRALQGELARTISSMPGVQSARVHITFAPKRLFSADQQDAKASIFIEQSEQVKLTDAQVSGIQKLTANAIERLDARNVSVFGMNGEELSLSSDSTVNNQLDRRYQIKYAMEQKLMEKAYRLLSLAISPEKIAVSIDVTLNFDQRKKMKQGFASDGKGVIMKEHESTIANEGKKSRSSEAAPTMSKEKDVEYMHGKETEETIYSSGEISKIAVGVALREDLTAKQVNKIKDVLTAGLGINTFRGDMLAVEVINIEPAVPVITLNPPYMERAKTAIQENEVDAKPSVLTSGPNVQKTFSDVSPWWLLGLILIPTIIVFFRKRQLGVQKREALLIEVQDWLRKEEQAHV